MGKARSKVKRPKTFRYNTDRKKLWKKSKQLPHIKCAEIKAAWDPKKSLEGNMKAMGLAADPNKTLKIDDTKVRIGPLSNKKPVKDLSGDTVMNETSVAQLLEKSATGPHETGIKLSEPEAALCMSRIEKHGQDYKAMARDADNVYQETPKQIRRKLIKFMRFPGPHADFLIRKGLPPMETGD